MCRYGAEGPGQGGGQQDGRCEGPQDCTRRAPVCSPLGFCTEGARQVERESGTDMLRGDPRNRHAGSEGVKQVERVGQAGVERGTCRYSEGGQTGRLGLYE